MKEQLFNYLSTNSGALTLEDVLLNFLMAAVLGTIVFLSYRLSHSGSVYSAKFNVSLLMLTLVTTLVMNVIGNNIALSLGMVGALSIVRFRTAIKDPRDTAYIFWCIAIGICCGVSEYMIAGIGSAVLFIFLIIFGAVRNNDRHLLVIRGKRAMHEEIEKTVEMVFSNKAGLRVKNTTAETIEYIYEISEATVKKAAKSGNAIDDLLYKIERTTQVNLVRQNDEING